MPASRDSSPSWFFVPSQPRTRSPGTTIIPRSKTVGCAVGRQRRQNCEMFAINLITFMVADLVVASLERVTPPLHCGRRKPRSSYAGNTAVDGRRRELPTSHTTGDTPGRQCFVRRWWQDHLLQLHLTMFGIVCWVCFMDAVRNIAGKKKKQTWFLGRTRMETLWEKSFIKRNHLSEVFSMQHILARFKKI